jgi:ubiquinone/menaquinone biosynthesis C-methylase UbiE
MIRPAKVPLVCPACGSGLPEAGSWQAPSVTCPMCAARYAQVNDVLRFVPDDFYSRSFSFEWQHHPQTLMDDATRHGTEQTLRRMLVTPELVKGRRVLDAGCGMGRFADVFTRWGAEVVAVDLSQAVEVARTNLEEREGATFVQADILHLPFPPATFDVILSWGVLHHTPDCAAAFRALCRLLRPGGTIAIRVYGKSRSHRRRVVNAYRRLTVHLPHRLLYGLCFVAVPLYYVYKVPILGNLLRVLVPVSRQRDAKERVLETFDEYSPRYQSRHTFPEVHGWFVEAGITDIRIFDPPVTAVGRRPLTAGG